MTMQFAQNQKFWIQQVSWILKMKICLFKKKNVNKVCAIHRFSDETEIVERINKGDGAG